MLRLKVLRRGPVVYNRKVPVDRESLGGTHDNAGDHDHNDRHPWSP